MSTSIGEKIKLIRESERLNRKQLSELSEIPYSSLSYYESGRTVPDTTIAMKLLNHPRFQKYALWFFTDQIAPESGQVAPALAHYGLGETISRPSDKKIG
ncbi:helix-turn-helix transcriptional regulator [Yersinia enterocolitica]